MLELVLITLMHAVHKLHHYRMSLSTTTYKSRGQRVIRCDLCRLAKPHCICSYSPKSSSNAGFLLLMYDTEVLKPSNTGKLIADVVPDTFAFLWSRTKENKEMLAILNDEQWQPYVVFPQQYAQPEREVFCNEMPVHSGKRPLFIMLDGCWREAKKMFRKSPYLNKFPIAAFDPHLLDEAANTSRYQIRVAEENYQFATAEVAARMLAMAEEPVNAKLLDQWFDMFSFQYQKSVCQKNRGNPQALDDYLEYTQKYNIALKGSE
jgi:DTW domain-containing protein YfiP